MTMTPDQSQPARIPRSVWLLVLGSALIVLLAICLPRPGAIKVPEQAAPPLADAAQRDVPSTLASSRPERPASGPMQKSLAGWVLDLESTNFEVVRTAMKALGDMGPDAAPAIPQLAQMLKEGRHCNAAAYTLADIGTNALPVLIDALTTGNPSVRLEAAGAIGTPSFREAGEAAVPALVECMRDPDARVNAIAALSVIPKRPDIAVPALIAALADPDVDDSADTTLRKYARVEAEATIPMLIQAARQEQNPISIRFRAAEIVRAAAPELAKAEGF